MLPSPVASQTATWYFDFISPFAYLQWQELRRSPLPVAWQPVPVLLVALLEQWGQKGPAEIPSKRRFTYRMVHWRAERAGTPLRFPPAHPFNPLPVLRLATALDDRVDVIDRIFRHIWLEGRACDTVNSLADLGREFAVDISSTLADGVVKAALRSNAERAIAAGVFGVPTMQVGMELFWGADSGQLLREYLVSPERFDTDEIRRLDSLPVGARRA
jgi:2-hydroxychromene-2-carboxylate isomerase